MKSESPRKTFGKTEVSNLIKIRPVETELFHADGQMDKRKKGRTDGYDKANNRFSQFFESA